uniref:Uncharacterized protein n=1 Tax=Salarias fasciatus TaxID=181472 RepID=A0A672JUB3_SALFA
MGLANEGGRGDDDDDEDDDGVFPTFQSNEKVFPLTDLGRVSPPGHVLGPDGLLDAVHLLLVALAVAGGVLLGFLQSRLQGLDPLSRSTKAPSRRSRTAVPFLQRLSSFSSHVMVFLRVLFFSFSRSYFCFHCSAVSSIFTVTVPTHLCPNIRVDLVSASL